MANWSAVRLVVIGPTSEVKSFAGQARPQVRAAPKLRVILGTVHREPRPADIFSLSMMIGEGQELLADRLENLGPGISQMRYSFQVRNDDGAKHFRTISRRYPTLQFVLAFHDPNGDAYGSYLICNGRSRAHLMPSDFVESVMAKHGYDWEAADDENEYRYWEASWDVTDHAEAKWLSLAYKRLGVHSTGRQKGSPKIQSDIV